jgi:hypothetical protein
VAREATRMTQLKRVALAAVAAGTAAIAATYVAAFVGDGSATWIPPVFVVGVATIMVGMMVLGAATARGIGKLAVPFAFTWFLMVGGIAAAHVLPSASRPYILGLPPAAALIIYGIGLLPIVVLPFAYALTFDSITLRREDIERVRAAGAAREKAP